MDDGGTACSNHTTKVVPRTIFDSDDDYFRHLIDHGLTLSSCDVSLRRPFTDFATEYSHRPPSLTATDLSDLSSLPTRASKLPAGMLDKKAAEIFPEFTRWWGASQRSPPPPHPQPLVMALAPPSPGLVRGLASEAHGQAAKAATPSPQGAAPFTLAPRHPVKPQVIITSQEPKWKAAERVAGCVTAETSRAGAAGAAAADECQSRRASIIDRMARETARYEHHGRLLESTFQALVEHQAAMGSATTQLLVLQAQLRELDLEQGGSGGDDGSASASSDNGAAQSDGGLAFARSEPGATKKKRHRRRSKRTEM